MAYIFYIRSSSGRVVAHRVSRQAFTMVIQVLSQASLCNIWDKVALIEVYQRTSVFTRQYHFIHNHFHLTNNIIRRKSRRRLETFQHSNLLSDIVEHCTKGKNVT
jgi:hypothetical protein